jgi:hypothetical protein
MYRQGAERAVFHARAALDAGVELYDGGGGFFGPQQGESFTLPNSLFHSSFSVRFSTVILYLFKGSFA